MLKELRAKFGTTVTTGELIAYNKNYMRRARAGELKLVRRGVWSLVDSRLPSIEREVAPVTKTITPEMIRTRFNTMSILADGIVKGEIRALMVAGSAGVGKTHELETKLSAGQLDGSIEYTAIKGSISAVGLYQALWNNKDKGQVLLLDDSDAIYSDEEALNLLKAALDTSTKRVISWAKASRFLRDEDIPNSFEYEGQIVFITNTDPDAIIARGGRMAPHMSALLSRTVFLDLCIHDAAAILMRIEQVIEDSDLCASLKISDRQASMIIEWMRLNVDRLRSVSIRSVIQLASFMKTSDDWETLAEMTMLKSNLT